MTAFIVSGGALLELGCPSSLARETVQQVGFTTTLGGKRKAHIRRGGRRAWSVNVSAARPGEVSTLEAVARGLGPYGWYPPEAVVGNLLSPQAAGFDPVPANGTGAGLVQLPDGSVAASIAASGTVRVGAAHGSYEMVPLRPSTSVTVGAWARGGLRLQGFWRDATGGQISGWQGDLSTHSGWKWGTHTMTPPAGAVFIELHLFGGSQYARPSVAWGSKGRDQGGMGCPVAVVHSPSFSPVALWEGTNYTDTSYQVTEVG